MSNAKVDIIERITMGSLIWFENRADDIEQIIRKYPSKNVVIVLFVPLIVTIILKYSGFTKLSLYVGIIPMVLIGIPLYGGVIYGLIYGFSYYSKFLRRNGIEKWISRGIVLTSVVGFLSIYYSNIALFST